MHVLALVSIWCLVFGTSLECAGQWKSVGGTVQFKIKNAGLTVNGSFKNLDASVIFDPIHPELAKMEAHVWVESIETGINLRNKHLKKEEYFHESRFPKISMKLEKLQKQDVKWIGLFQLTLKGITKMLEIPIEFEESKTSASLKGQFVVNRLDFDIGNKSWTMGEMVTATISIKLSPEK